MNDETLKQFFDSIEKLSDMQYFILGDDHQPVEVPMFEWAKWFATDARQIAINEGDGWCVSSIFLGFDHSSRSDEGHPKLLFETLIAESGVTDVNRLATFEECMAFHLQAVDGFRGEITP